MRLRNVKDKSELDNSQYIINNYKDLKGNYKSLFNNDNPIHIEIGMGKGKFITDMALKHPHINFIGIEKFSSVMIRAVQRVCDMDIPNLKLILMDAYEIDEVFSNEIDTIYLNFSDPWPKKRHAKRRLTSDVFLSKYDSVFKGDNKIIQKTDNMHLFEYSLSSLSLYGYILNEVSLDLHSINDKDNVTTEYEDKFILIGKPIYRVKASKCKID